MKRLRDDAALRGLGVRLEDDGLVRSAHDLAALRARVLASAGTPAAVAASGALAAKLGAVVAALLGAGVVLFWLRSGTAPPAPRPVVAHVVELRPAPIAPAAPPVVIVEPSPAPVIVRSAPSSASAVGRHAPRPAVAAEPAPSDLSEQLELYASARAALRRNDLAGAIAGFGAYRTRYPAGALRIEAGISLLEAFLTAHRFEAAAGLASELAADPGFAHRRGEILRARGQALARLGRCAEAREALVTAGVGDEALVTTLRGCE